MTNHTDKTKLFVVKPDDAVHDTHHGFQRGWGVSYRTTGSQAISMAHGVLAPGAKAEPHYHPFETAIYIIRGAARVYYGPNLDQILDCHAGEYVYIAPGVVHSPETLGDEPMEYIASRSAPEDIYFLPGTGPMA